MKKRKKKQFSCIADGDSIDIFNFEDCKEVKMISKVPYSAKCKQQKRGYVKIEGKSYFRVKFYIVGTYAQTLKIDEVCENYGEVIEKYESSKPHSDDVGYFKRTHEDGWTIEGMIIEDYFYWVEEFKASHPKYGKMWGNFSTEVYAESEEAYENFFMNHKPKCWDMADI